MEAALGVVRDGLVVGARNPLLLMLAILAGWALVLVRPARGRRILDRLRRGVRPAAIAAASLIVAGFVAVMIWYAALPSLAEEVEPNVGTVSWMLATGHSLYHEADAPAQYSVLYGPTVYLANAAVMRVLGPSLVTAKLATLGASLAGLLFLYLTCRTVLDAGLALVPVGAAAAFYAAIGPYSYVIRPDAILVCCVAFGLLVVVRAGPVLAVVGLAAALGLAVDLKVHAVLFMLPLLERMRRRYGPRAATAAALGGVFVAALPFLLHPQISFGNYLVWIGAGMRHGIDGSSVLHAAGLAAFLLLPSVALDLRLSRCGHADATARRDLVLLVACATIVLVIIGKPGAGPAHLLPLVPTSVWWMVERLARLRDAVPFARLTLPPRRFGLLVAVVSSAWMAGVITQYRTMRELTVTSAEVAGVAQDLEQILREHDGLRIGMGYGGEGRFFRATWYRPLLAFAGHAPLVDVVAVMERQRAGFAVPAATLEALRRGDVDVWLIPRSREPFAKKNWYPPHQPAFSEDFVTTFRAHHVRWGRSTYFDLWFHERAVARAATAVETS